MGAQMFRTSGQGKTVQEAYRDARDEAAFENGHQEGYSGDIQTCSGYKEVQLKEGDTVDDVEESICDNDSYNGKRFEKWGNCAAVQTSSDEWTFIGWGAC